MRKTLAPKLEGHRIWDGEYGSKPGELHGCFQLGDFLVISSGADSKYGWEHVSVSRQDRAPTWAEMCAIKDLFWNDNECVVQFHPARKDYVNFHPHCLHLWRSARRPMPTPPTILVGPKQED
jgi:hypothetical protein